MSKFLKLKLSLVVFSIISLTSSCGELLYPFKNAKTISRPPVKWLTNITDLEQHDIIDKSLENNAHAKALYKNSKKTIHTAISKLPNPSWNVRAMLLTDAVKQTLIAHIIPKHDLLLTLELNTQTTESQKMLLILDWKIEQLESGSNTVGATFYMQQKNTLNPSQFLYKNWRKVVWDIAYGMRSSFSTNLSLL